MGKRDKSNWFQKWRKRLNRPNHAIHIAVLALLVTAATYTFSTSTAQQARWESENMYLKQLMKEIDSNLNGVKFYEDQGKQGHIQVPIVPVMVVYEAGLENGLVGRLPPSTQNSLFTAYKAGQRIIQQSSDYKLTAYGSDEYKNNTAVTGVFVDQFKVNLEDTYTRGLYLTDLYRSARDMSFIASVFLFLCIIAQFVLWSFHSILTLHKKS